MNLQKHIKEIVITLSVISITAGAYATLSNVSTGDGLTATLWNSMVTDVNSNTTKLTNISSNGANVGIGVASPSYNLEVKGAGSSSVFRLLNDTYGTLNLGVDVNQPWLGTQTNNDLRVITNNTEKIRVKNDGNVGIGTTSPIQKLDVAGAIRSSGSNVINNTNPTTYYVDTDHRSAMIHVNSNLFYILRGCATNSDTWCTYNSNWPLYINLENNAAHFGGDVYGVSFNSSSDKRLKKNIKTLDNSLENVSKLRGVSFDWKSTGKSELGLIAQEVEEVYPDLVDTDEKGMKSVKYSNLVAPLIESVKELKKENDEKDKIIEKIQKENQKKDKQIEYILQEIEKLKSK